MTWTNVWLFFIAVELGFLSLCVYAIGEKISEYDKKEK